MLHGPAPAPHAAKVASAGGKPKKQGQPGSTPFMNGAGLPREVVHPNGRDPKHEKRMTLLRLQRKRKTTITDKHKQFLAELQAERSRLLGERARMEEKRAKRSAKFAARQAEFRRAVTEGEFEGEGGQETDSAVGAAKSAAAAPASLEGKGGARKSSQGAKPAWALSAAEAEAKEDEEAEDLMAFVDGLDLDSFMEEADEKSAAAGVDARLSELESEVKSASAALHQAEALWEEEEVDVPEYAEAGPGWEWVGEAEVISEGCAPPGGEGGEGKEEGGVRMVRRVRRRLRRTDAERAERQRLQAGLAEAPPAGGGEVAESVMSHASIRSVHSKQSVQHLIQREKAERAAANAGMPVVAEEAAGGVFSRSRQAAAGPRIAHVLETADTRPARKEVDVNTLPYRHLHPAV